MFCLLQMKNVAFNFSRENVRFIMLPYQRNLCNVKIRENNMLVGENIKHDSVILTCLSLCENNMLLSRVKISCFCVTAQLLYIISLFLLTGTKCSIGHFEIL